MFYLEKLKEQQEEHKECSMPPPPPALPPPRKKGSAVKVKGGTPQLARGWGKGLGL